MLSGLYIGLQKCWNLKSETKADQSLRLLQRVERFLFLVCERSKKLLNKSFITLI